MNIGEKIQGCYLQQTLLNNEFYVAPAYNKMISSSKKIAFFNIGRLGTPEDLNNFLNAVKVKQ